LRVRFTGPGRLGWLVEAAQRKVTRRRMFRRQSGPNNLLGRPSSDVLLTIAFACSERTTLNVVQWAAPERTTIVLSTLTGRASAPDVRRNVPADAS